MLPAPFAPVEAECEVAQYGVYATGEVALRDPRAQAQLTNSAADPAGRQRLNGANV